MPLFSIEFTSDKPLPGFSLQLLNFHLSSHHRNLPSGTIALALLFTVQGAHGNLVNITSKAKALDEN